jgi:hypothetical protein
MQVSRWTLETIVYKSRSARIAKSFETNQNFFCDSSFHITSMLSEHFVISTLGFSKASTSDLKDSNIQLYDHKSTSIPFATFKKTSTAPNALSISPSHVYAAQAQKATVHVYSREKRNQEAVVAFPERVRCIHFVGDVKDGGVGILIVGTEEGRLVIWEVLFYTVRSQVSY